MRPGLQRAGRLVESDMTVGANPEHLQIDPPCIRNLTFVSQTLCLGIRGGAVEKMTVFRSDVHAIEEMRLHEAAVAPGVRAGNAEELIEIERHDAREVRSLGMQLHQLAIERK